MGSLLALRSQDAFTVCGHLLYQNEEEQQMVLSPIVKPPPGFSQDTAKEERNQYLGTLPKCPAFLMSDQRANEVCQTLWSPVLNVLTPLSLKQEPQISVSQLRESES